MDGADFINQFLIQHRPIFPVVSDKSKTSRAEVLLVKFLIKYAGSSEFQALDNIRSIAPDVFEQIFPRIYRHGTINEKEIWEIEYIEGETLEEILLTHEKPDTSYTQHVCQKLQLLASVQSDLVINNCFFITEISETLAASLTKCGLAWPNFDSSQLEFKPTLCHRDLSVGNIIISNFATVKFIDPSTSLPNAPKTSYDILGSIAVDYAALFVSIYRKNLERLHLGLQNINDSLELLAQFVEANINTGYFNGYTFRIFLILAFSIYVACDCDYCTAPERKWLWEQMRTDLKDLLEETSS